MLFTYYQHAPMPAMSRNDEILPLFIVNSLSGGAAGFIVAAIVCRGVVAVAQCDGRRDRK